MVAEASKPHRPVEAYLQSLDAPKRRALERVRQAILSAAPAAEEGVSYGMPAFIVDGKAIASFAAFTDHLSFFPMSGTVLGSLKTDLAGYKASKGTVQFTTDHPLPSALVRRIVKARLAELKAQKEGRMRRPHSRPGRSAMPRRRKTERKAGAPRRAK